MDKTEHSDKAVLSLIIYWTVVSLPLFWGIWKTALKLPALFH